MWKWPLDAPRLAIPVNKAPGAFGVSRKYDIHTGVDLYCPDGTQVYPVEPGQVIDVGLFTGPNAGSPWWNETYACLVEGESGIVLYGELHNLVVWVGDEVDTTTPLGYVKQVLKTDKGLPMSMLHLELYESGSITTVATAAMWELKSPKPTNLINPTTLLSKAKDR